MKKPKVMAPLQSWLSTRLTAEMEQMYGRLRFSRGVRRIAVMPDAHLATDVCVGTVMATTEVIYPAAVGGDIGCGMATLAFDGEANWATDGAGAPAVFAKLRGAVPSLRRATPLGEPGLPGEGLGVPTLEKVWQREGRWQLGTLGRGNHFLELQEEVETGRLWVMVHTGSRAMGQAICGHYMKAVAAGRKYLVADSDRGRDYLADHAWARQYALVNRKLLLKLAAEVIAEVWGLLPDWESYQDCDHNHISLEEHYGELVHVHRKGAIRL